MKATTIAALLLAAMPCSLHADAVIISSNLRSPTGYSSRLSGAALLGEDGHTVTQSRIVLTANYEITDSVGTWNGTQLDVTGFGCAYNPYPASCSDQTPLQYAGNRITYLDDPDSLSGTWEETRYSAEVVPIGDSTLNGTFDSSDLILVMQLGHYEDNEICFVNEMGFDQCEWNENGQKNSHWINGDWNLDREFDSGDLITAFQSGGYMTAAIVIPEPSSMALLTIGVLLSIRRSY